MIGFILFTDEADLNIDSESNLRQVNVSWVTARWPVKVCSNLTKIEMYKRYVVRWGPADSTDVESMTIISLEGTAIFSVVRRGNITIFITHLFSSLSLSPGHTLSFTFFLCYTLRFIPIDRTYSLSVSHTLFPSSLFLVHYLFLGHALFLSSLSLVHSLYL